MTKREQVIAAIEDLGYKTETDAEGDIVISYQLKNLFALIGNEDENYLLMMFPQFYDIEDGEDALMLATCNKVSRELKLVKVYVDESFKSVTATCEFYYNDDESLRQNLYHSLRVLGLVRSAFRSARAELSD